MNVYLRDVDKSTGHLFCECAVDEIADVIAELKRGGGVYCNGSYITELSYQFVLGDNSAFAEIIVGGDV